MMGSMATTETTSNPPETLSDFERLEKILDHQDQGIHQIQQDLERIEDRLISLLAFIELHKPALARGLALMDPGAKMRAMLPGRKRG